MFSRRFSSCLLVLLQPLFSSGLAGSQTDPLKCKPKFAVVDIKNDSNNYINIPYEICTDPAVVRSCDNPIPGDETILEAQLIDNNGKTHNLSPDRQSFNVSIHTNIALCNHNLMELCRFPCKERILLQLRLSTT